MADHEYDEQAAIQAALKLSMLTAQEDDKRRSLKYGVTTRTVLPDQTDRALKARSTGVLEARNTTAKPSDRGSVPPRPAPPTCIARPRPAGNNRTASVERQVSVPMSGYVSTPTSATASPMDSPDFLSKLPPPLPTVGPNSRSRQPLLGAKTPPSSISQPKIMTAASSHHQRGHDRPLIALSPPVKPVSGNLFDFDLSALDPLNSNAAPNIGVQQMSDKSQSSVSNLTYGTGNKNLSTGSSQGGVNAMFATVDKPSASVPAITPGSKPIYGSLEQPPGSSQLATPTYGSGDRMPSHGITPNAMAANAIYGTVDLKPSQGLPAAGASTANPTYGHAEWKPGQSGVAGGMSSASSSIYGTGSSGQRASTPVMGYSYGSYPLTGASTGASNYIYGSSNLACNTVALPSMVGPGAMHANNNPPAASQQYSAPGLSRPGNRTPVSSSGGTLALVGSSAYSTGMSVALPPTTATLNSNPSVLTVALPSSSGSSASNSSGMTVALPPTSTTSIQDETQPLVPMRSEPINKPSSLSVNSTGRSRSPVSPFFAQMTSGAMPSPGLEAGDLMDFSHDFEPAEECLSLASFDPLFNVEESRPNMTGTINSKPGASSQALVPYNPEDPGQCPPETDTSFELLDPFSVSDLTITLEKKRKKHALEKTEREKLQRKKPRDTKTVEMPPVPSPSRPSAQKLSRRNSYISRGQESTYEMLHDFSETADEEIHAFCTMVTELKQECSSTSQLPHHGLVVSPQMQFPPYTDMTVKIVVYNKISVEPIIFTCDLAVSVEHVISQVLLTLSDDMGSTSTDDYILRVFSLMEYLINGTVLGSYEYVQQCIKLDHDIKLTLLAEGEIPKSLLRTAEDDQQPVFVPKPRDHDDLDIKVTRDKLNILMETFYREVEKLRDQALQEGCKKVQCRSVVQAVKAICAVLCKIEIIDIIRAVQKLQTVTIEKSLRPASPSNRDAFVLVTEEGDAVGPVVEAENKQLSEMDDLHSALEELTQSVKSLIELYCRTFHTDFRFESATNVVRESHSLIDVSEFLIVHIASLHRVPLKWRNTYEEYKVLCGLYHGGRRLCAEEMTTVRSSGAETSFQETLVWDEWMQFDNILVSSLPRETRLTFTLIGVKTVTSGSNSESQKQRVNAPLGWVALQLFNHKSQLVQGSQLLGLWLGENANPTGTSQSNTEMLNSVLLQVNLPDYEFDIMFPEFTGSKQNPKQDFRCLHPDDKERLRDILHKDLVTRLTPEEMEFLWEKRYYLFDRAEALAKVMQAAPCWSYPALEEMYTLMKHWRQPRPIQAMQLLLARYADTNLRNYAVQCLDQLTDDELSDFMTQLIQALKFESYHTSRLAQLLLKRSASSIRIAHQMYWFLKEAAEDVSYRKRYQLLFGALLSVVGQAVRSEFSKQEDLVKMLAAIAEKVKAAKDKEAVLQRELENMFDFLNQASTQLPLNPGMEVVGVDSKSCSYFTSNTFPLKLVLLNTNPQAEPIYAMFKMGDDLRQDMLTMQLIRIMDKLWLREGLDLRMVTFRCQATGSKKGLVELVTEAETLRKIQVKHGHGLAGSFKDRPIAEWLQVQNPTELEYQKAVDNFVASCAGYCVATYMLGICDRHNDNIMIKHSGHMFHIDFGKFLGDAQMIGNFKRDRTAFVLTSDMAYVIKGGEKGSHKFQTFVDLCCQAFNILRRHSDLFLTLFSMMARSGVPGVNQHAVKYVQRALLPDHTDTEAIAFFTRLIEESLRSMFTQINFFFHNLAQMKFSGHQEGALLSFIPKTYSIQTDGRIKSVEVFGYQKRYNPEKYYIYIIRVDRENQKVPSFIFRRYSEFQELHHKLVLMYPLVRLPNLPPKVFIGRAHVKTVAEARKAEVEKFLQQLVRASTEVAESDLVSTFFHPMLRDEQDIDKTNLQKLKEPNQSRSVTRTIQGAMKLTVFYRQDTLTVMVMHVKDLCGEAGETPDPYVKTYLLPDPLKYTKRKTKISKGTFHPTYNEVLLYRIPLEEVVQRTLQASVWNYNSLEENEFLGAVLLPLCELDLSQETTQWYPLANVHHVTINS